LSDTSMAIPHVSGTVALVEEANPALGPDGIERVIMATVTLMPWYAEFEAGAGYLDAYEAVARARALR
jgi:serine protease AprX